MTSRANQTGDTTIARDLESQMVMFDSLPKRLRRVFANADHKYDLTEVMATLRGGATVDMVIEVVEQFDRENNRKPE